MSTANALFGPDPAAQQPSSSSDPEHLGRPEPIARTIAPHAGGHADSPALAMVVLAGVAVVILHLISRD